MSKSKRYDYKIVVTSVGENVIVMTGVKKGMGEPKTYTEIIDLLKAATQIYEEKKTMYGDNVNL